MIRASLLTAAVLTVAACGTSDADTDTAEPAAGVEGSASCSDATGDGGAADLVSVDLQGNGDELQVTYTLSAPPNMSAGTFLLSIIAWSEDGEAGRQLGVKWIDGEPQAFVFDFGDSSNDYVDVP